MHGVCRIVNIHILSHLEVPPLLISHFPPGQICGKHFLLCTIHKETQDATVTCSDCYLIVKPFPHVSVGFSVLRLQDNKPHMLVLH